MTTYCSPSVVATPPTCAWKMPSGGRAQTPVRWMKTGMVPEMPPIGSALSERPRMTVLPAASRPVTSTRICWSAESSPTSKVPPGAALTVIATDPSSEVTATSTRVTAGSAVKASLSWPAVMSRESSVGL